MVTHVTKWEGGHTMEDTSMQVYEMLERMTKEERIKVHGLIVSLLQNQERAAAPGETEVYTAES